MAFGVLMCAWYGITSLIKYSANPNWFDLLIGLGGLITVVLGLFYSAKEYYTINLVLKTMEATRVQFRAPWDKKLTTITGILVVLLGALLFTGPGGLISAIIWSIILGCAFFGVYGYSI